MRILFSVCAASLLALALAAGSASAQGIVLVDYTGYAFETGGLPPSDPGDELVMVGNASAVDPVTGVDLANQEVTIYAHGLIAAGTTVGGSGQTTFAYSGGTLEVYADAAKNSSYGTFPPNATAPSTFADGTLLFSGDVNSFTLVLTAVGYGAYEAYITPTGGSLIGGGLCPNCSYTWGGAFNSLSGAQVPDGYDIQVDGQLEVDPVVETSSAGWGQIKAMFKD